MHIIIADDHFLVLDGLEVLLSTIGFVDKVNRAKSLAEIESLLANAAFDVLLLDINLGNEDGRELIALIRKRAPGLKIIALTSYGDAATIKSAFRAGFDGYLLKTDGREEIIAALQAVSDGGQYISPQAKDHFVKEKVTGIQPHLTQRELEILQLIVQEKTTKEIAEELFLSEKTVENHRASILLKLDVKNIAGAVRKAIVTGLVEV